MDIIEHLLSHRSIRKYKDQKIEKQLLNKIIEAGIRTSNTGNMQIYSIIVTQDEEKRKELAKFHFNQQMVIDAPVVLTICADVNRFHKWCELRNAGTAYDNFLWFLTGTIDATIVTQNICVAAESEGLGICYLGTVNYNTPEISEFLNIPRGVVPVTTITIGYPDESPEQNERLPLDGVVHYEAYKDYSAEDIERIYQDKEALDFSKEIVKTNGVENLAQVFTQKRYAKKGNEAISKKLITYLKETGFIEEWFEQLIS